MCDDTKTPDANSKNSDAPLDLTAEQFRHHIDEFDLTEEQQTELLQTLWNIMSTFVDIGWGVDTVQLYLPELFNEPSSDKLAPDSGKLLESNSSPEHLHNAQREQG